MSENTVFVKRYVEDDAVFPVNEQEIWRYSGYKGLADTVDEELKKVLNEVRNDLKTAFSYKVCYRRMKIHWKDEMPQLPFPSESKELARCLKGCDEVIFFAATIGLELDRYIARNQRFSPTKALLAQAYGAERVEALCDVFCEEISDEVQRDGLSCTMRFSPGYGDLPLAVQREFFRLLDCNRQIGVSLNDSLLMTPSKSVTAIFGLRAGTERQCDTAQMMDAELEADAMQRANAKSGSRHACAGNAGNKCARCVNVNCEFRRV